MRHALWGLLWVAAAIGCDGAKEGTKAAEQCAEDDLIAQCPPGSDPRLDAASTAQCEGSGSLDLIEQNGSFTAACAGEGSCVVLCQFVDPCECGVLIITSDELRCKSCEDRAACGNGVCEGGEGPDTCPLDCSGECTPGAERCNGDGREVCGNDGRWDPLACPEGDTCSEETGRPLCVRDRI